MSKKKETRGRKSIVHKPLNVSFKSALGTIAGSKKQTRTQRKKK